MMRNKDDELMIALHELDDLYQRSLEYRSSRNYMETLKFIARMRDHSPYNAMLLRMQNPGITYALSAKKWGRKFGREVNRNARPYIILIPFGPVSLVYDIEDTTGPELPPDILDPFRSDGELDPLVWENLNGNCENNGILIRPVSLSVQHAGSVTLANTEPSPEGLENRRGPEYWYVIEVNDRLSTSNKFATIIHELGHVFCGHCGGYPGKENVEDRSCFSQEIEEFEAESVSYIVCKRNGILSESETYLAGYVGKNETIPMISMNTVLKAAKIIEGFCNKKLKRARG